jgi:hypothetical protein
MVTLFKDVSFLHGVSGRIRSLGWDNSKRSILMWLDEANVPLVCRTEWADPSLVKDLVAFLRKAKSEDMLITTGVKYGFDGRTWFCAAMENKIVAARREFVTFQAEDELAYSYDGLYDDDPNDMASDGYTKEDEQFEAALQHKINMTLLDKKIKKLEIELMRAKVNCPEGYTIVPKVNGEDPYLCQLDSASSHYVEEAKDPLFELRRQRDEEEFVV